LFLIAALAHDISVNQTLRDVILNKQRQRRQLFLPQSIKPQLEILVGSL